MASSGSQCLSNPMGLFQPCSLVLCLPILRDRSTTPFLKANEDVPQNILKCDKAINKTMITLNIFFPLMYGISTFQWNYVEIYIGEKPLWLVIGARLLINVIVFLQIVSGTFVGYALFKIKQSINKEDASIVNVKTMTFHLLAFGIYTFSALIN